MQFLYVFCYIYDQVFDVLIFASIVDGIVS